jgi:hypothetical protein
MRTIPMNRIDRTRDKLTATRAVRTYGGQVWVIAMVAEQWYGYRHKYGTDFGTLRFFSDVERIEKII